MSTQTTTPNPTSRPSLYYVAPKDPPASRRPPSREVGLNRWLRENLFSTPLDSVLTLVTLFVLGAFILGFLNWALLEAQWEIVFNNLRVFNVGNQFPINGVWRAQSVGAILVFLGLLSVGVWGRLLRWQIVIVVLIAILMVTVPVLSEVVPEPSVYTYLDAKYDVRQVNFVAQAGQTITFTIDPLTTPDDFRLETITGYVENDNQQANTAFDSYSAASTEVIFNQTRDPAQYDLSMAIQVWDNTGQIIAQSDFSAGSTENTVLAWTAPYSGWFTYTAVSDTNVPSTQGIAWLRADNLEVIRSTVSGQRERAALYGEPPVLDCQRCATQVNRTDMRYQGHRTLPQWFSLQLTPFLLETRPSFFVAVVLGGLAYLLGTLAKRQRLALLPLPERVELWLGRAAIAVSVIYVIAQLIGVNGGNANTTPIYLGLLALLVGVVTLYALALLVRGGEAAGSRAVTVLWAVSFPVMLTLLNGVAGIESLKQIPSEEQGGLILTLLLSSVAIIVSFPIGLLLALGRQSPLPVVSGFCTAFIEVVRGVPLITLIFGGWLILPFFGFGLQDVDLMLRIMVVLTLFTSAYLAEVIRGGLQTIPKGQIEAAHALGLNDFYTNILIVIPQALRLVIPAMMGQAVSLFKDTSLVYVIGLFELVGVTTQILGDAQTGYLMFPREAYLFVGIVYFVFSYIMAEASRRLEKTGSGAIRRETI